jgi:NADPH:quinone reductase-like Zn-dependent oxidoreductase
MLRYPLILGCDVAGTVEVVPNASSSPLHVGDGVFGFSANNGFQEHVAFGDKLVAKIPDGIACRDVVGLGLCSASSAMFLFAKDNLGLEYPSSAAPKRGGSVLVWGGGSAVGSNAIQLATTAGYNVIATCSRRNFNYVQSLGDIRVLTTKRWMWLKCLLRN